MEPVLVNASIVVLMSHPGPGTFTPQFFKKHGLFQELALVNQVIVPVITQYAFEGGIFFEAVEDRVKIECHNTDTDTKQATDDDTHIGSVQNLAIPLFESIDYMAPTAIGLNFQFRLGASESLQSFVPTLSDKFQVRQTVLRHQDGDRQLNLIFGVVEGINPQELAVEANMHYQLTGDAPEHIIGVIKRMPAALGEVRSELAEIARRIN